MSLLPHIKEYDGFFGYDRFSFKPCEITGKRLQDHHHILNKGMGGSKDLDYIENIMGLIRLFHVFFGDVEKYIPFLQEVHAHFMKTRVPWAEAHPEDPRIWLAYGKNYDFDWNNLEE